MGEDKDGVRFLVLNTRWIVTLARDCGTWRIIVDWRCFGQWVAGGWLVDRRVDRAA
jgi:hypothetical protein